MTEVCDYLVIGGGSAGCIVAKRLSEKSRGRIILLEAGKSDEGDRAAIDLSRLDEQTADYDWGFRASTTPGSAPELAYSRARILGGCANHNDCAFIRPPDSDFDEWERRGAKGWDATTMARYFNRVIDMIAVETAPRHRISRAFVAAGREMGLPEVDFRHGARRGVGWFPLNAKGAIRQSSSIAYLHPLKALPKHLEVRTGTMATRLIVRTGKAIGAETAGGAIHAARAVILACGAIQTPQLMMVSGLGPGDDLRRNGIEVISDIPDLGHNLQDHVAAPVIWATREPIEPWQICPLEATMMLTLDADEPAPDILFHFGLRAREKYAVNPRYAITEPAIRASPNVTRARSRGSVSLSGSSMRDKPRIDLNYFSDPYDLPLLLRALKFARKLGETEAMRAICKAEIYPGPEVQSDDQWASYIRRVCETVFHPCGTAMIGKVVDSILKVRRVDNLFVADASVFPTVPTVNINCAVMMAAERAADLVYENS